jgi:transcriptional regulator with XRE-family HTH domain
MNGDNMKELIRSIVDRATSMNQAAKRSGLSQAGLSEWCSGKVNPGLEKYVMLCRGLGCRPGYELDQYLGLGDAPPKFAEDVLRSVLTLSAVEQQRLISLITSRYAQSLAVANLINIPCLLYLIKAHIKENELSDKKFMQATGLEDDQYALLMSGALPPYIEESNEILSLLAAELKNPNTGMTFKDREELIEYCHREIVNLSDSATL